MLGGLGYGVCVDTKPQVAVYQAWMVLEACALRGF